MNDILQQLISLSIEFEGNLRVAAARDSAEAMSAARDKFDRMSVLMAALSPVPDDKPGTTLPEDTDDTIVKDDEATGAEEAPLEEPDTDEVPAEPLSPVVESDADAVEAAAAEARDTEQDRAVSVRSETVTLGDSFTARETRDLRKAFTLNDKFLFRRELFGGSEQEFADTLDLLTAMHSYDEAVEYLIDDLQWDAENATVKDFMGIVAGYFKSRAD
ncbi:MAG: hypothetical protein Q4C34_02865 [Bacteroidales bacterium]|nr:hypothetical protein [Bacteroidales bacterium]